MTPRLLVELMEQRAKTYEALALPVDKLVAVYLNSKRDPGGDDGKGNIRPPSPEIKLEDVLTVYTSKKANLAAKFKPDSVDRSLFGAEANRDAFDAWAGARSGAEFVPTKPTEE